MIQGTSDGAVAAVSAADRLRAFASFVDRAEPVHILPTLMAMFTSENYEQESPNSRVTSIMNWQKRGGFELMSDIKQRENYAEALVRHRVTTEYWRLGVEIEQTDPYRIETLLLGRAPLPVQQTARSDKEIARDFITYVGALAERELFSGAVLIGRHGEILDSAAYGFANRDFAIANTIDTRFNVASLTKTWTATAICKLIEAGKLTIETPLSDFIEYPTREVAQGIRIKHLLSHTSGLGGYFNDAFYATPRDKVRSLDDFLDLAKNDMPKFAPGSAWDYCNIGMILLGKVIEAISGQTYYDHMRDAIFEPAGMTRTEFIDLDGVNPDVAVGYHRRWSPNGPIVTNALLEWAVRGAPDGCGFAPIIDVWRFAETFRGGHLVTEAMFELMTTAKPELSSPDYGFGTAVHPERAIVGHSGGLIGASANIDITFEPEGWTVVILANDLSMRTPVLKARQMIGVTVPEAEDARAYLPRGGMTPR